MKNPFTLIAILLLLVLGGLQLTALWQQDTSAADEKGEKASQGDSDKQIAPSSRDAEQVIQQARNRLYERQSVQAEMTEVATMGEYVFRSTGTYASASGFRYRLEHTVELGGLRGVFLEVCDGQVLHTRRQISDAKSNIASTEIPQIELTRRDIQKIRREAIGLKESLQGAALNDALQAAEVGIGGLPSVLASLERNLTFDAVKSETIEGREYLVVQGRWKKDRHDQLFSGMGSARSQVAGFLPDLVRIYVARETMFPEKFLYLKQVPKDKSAFRPMLAIEFKNVELDQPIAENLFVYVAPPGMEEKDDTAAFLEGMRQTAEAASAQGQKSTSKN
ncbi:hypothetical protein SH668x_000609 [Planctomicrobium sp. SH668]|uniref:hypothetical protein n=1 Tax=Planctomicrobium sp. SH668 TaxID=3448126 RepID=UPI003F5C21AE